MASIVLMASFVQSLLGILMFLSAIFLILLVLIQRGRGGGLAGALGGMGGQSAFGSKAGDTFTKVTIVVASFWIFLCLVAVWILGQPQAGLLSDKPGPDSGADSVTETAPGSASADSSSTTDPKGGSGEAGLSEASDKEEQPRAAEISREEDQLDLGAPPEKPESEPGPASKEESRQ